MYKGDIVNEIVDRIFNIYNYYLLCKFGVNLRVILG